MVIEIGEMAPAVRGVWLGKPPTAMWFFKDTCPVCQMSVPAVNRFEDAYPGRVTAVSQDPEPKATEFVRRYGLRLPLVTDAAPHPASEAYGIEVVPTLVLVGPEYEVLDVVESWDRIGYNRVSRKMAEQAGKEYSLISSLGDGFPDFRPG